MGDPAKKLDPAGLRRPIPEPRRATPARVLLLPRRTAGYSGEEAWVIEQIVRWYQTRRD